MVELCSASVNLLFEPHEGTFYKTSPLLRSVFFVCLFFCVCAVIWPTVENKCIVQSEKYVFFWSLLHEILSWVWIKWHTDTVFPQNPICRHAGPFFVIPWAGQYQSCFSLQMHEQYLCLFISITSCKYRTVGLWGHEAVAGRIREACGWRIELTIVSSIFQTYFLQTLEFHSHFTNFSFTYSLLLLSNSFLCHLLTSFACAAFRFLPVASFILRDHAWLWQAVSPCAV